MTVPVPCLLGFAAWTLVTLPGKIGVYRWSRFLIGRGGCGEKTSFGLAQRAPVYFNTRTANGIEFEF